MNLPNYKSDNVLPASFDLHYRKTLLKRGFKSFKITRLMKQIESEYTYPVSVETDTQRSNTVPYINTITSAHNL